MTRLFDQISETLMPGMVIPQPIALLFQWIESNSLFIDTPTGERIGFLFPEEELKEWRLQPEETARPGGTRIEIFAEGNINLKYWFGRETPEILNRLSVFAQTGGEGSMAAFWLDDAGQQKIVHLGSGSGSALCCVLADDPVDFLRLLAIGYDEICWSEDFSEPPDTDRVLPNIAFQQWVRGTFAVEISRTASEIVKCPAQIGDLDSPDSFCRWVEQNASW